MYKYGFINFLQKRFFFLHEQLVICLFMQYGTVDYMDLKKVGLMVVQNGYDERTLFLSRQHGALGCLDVRF